MPTKWVRSRYKPTDLGAVKYLARSPMPSGHLTRAVNAPNAQTRGGIGTLWYISLVYVTPCAQNQNDTCHLQIMDLLMALTANYVNRYAYEMGQTLIIW